MRELEVDFQCTQTRNLAGRLFRCDQSTGHKGMHTMRHSHDALKFYIRRLESLSVSPTTGTLSLVSSSVKTR